jgi:hypothetical protein
LKEINTQAACDLLTREMEAEPIPGATLLESLKRINNLRIEKSWPMVTSMSCFNPSLTPPDNTPLDLDLKPLRAYWQAGLILVMKHDRHMGVLEMLEGCKPLAQHSGEYILCQLARVLVELLPLMELNDVDILIELAGRFDKCLRDVDHLQFIPAECLLRDCLFYLSIKKPDEFPDAYRSDDKSHAALEKRLHWHAKLFSKLLYPNEDEAKIDKTLIEKNLVPLTDALLFLGEIQLRTRMILRLDKIEERMLKIAVPVQLLMAEALRLS